MFTAISCVIPPVLSLVCFHDRIKAGSKFVHCVVIVLNVVFMCVSTTFSGYVLICKMVR